MAPAFPFYEANSEMLRIVDFKTEYRAGKDPVDWVLLAPAGAAFEKQQSWHRVAKLRPPENVDDTEKGSQKYQDLEAKWSVIGPAYEAWRAGREVPENGTPLEAWSGVTPDQATFLRKMGIKTVEDVRDMGDRALQELRWPNSRRLPDLAKRWLEGEAVAEKDARIAEMQEQMDAMKELLEEQMKASKRGPGRPKKEAEAA